MSTTSPAKYSQRPSEFLSNSIYSSRVYLWCGIVDMTLLLTHRRLRQHAAPHTGVTSDEDKNVSQSLQASLPTHWCYSIIGNADAAATHCSRIAAAYPAHSIEHRRLNPCSSPGRLSYLNEGHGGACPAEQGKKQ